MAFPIIAFKATNTDVTEELQNLMDSKLRSLEKFITTETDLNCEVEFERVTAHQTGDIYRVEVNFYKDGQLFRAEATRDTFQNAIDEVRDELDKEMRRANKKRDTLVRRGGRAIKDMLRFGK